MRSSLVPVTVDNIPSSLVSVLTLQARKNKNDASLTDQMTTAILETCTLSGKSVIPLNTQKMEANPKAPVPSKSKWYCTRGKARLIPIPNILIDASIELYWINVDADSKIACCDVDVTPCWPPRSSNGFACLILTTCWRGLDGGINDGMCFIPDRFLGAAAANVVSSEQKNEIDAGFIWEWRMKREWWAKKSRHIMSPL